MCVVRNATSLVHLVTEGTEEEEEECRRARRKILSVCGYDDMEIIAPCSFTTGPATNGTSRPL